MRYSQFGSLQANSTIAYSSQCTIEPQPVYDRITNRLKSAEITRSPASVL
ncbi:hypothetical protein [Microcoleus sp. F4-D5]